MKVMTDIPVVSHLGHARINRVLQNEQSSTSDERVHYELHKYMTNTKLCDDQKRFLWFVSTALVTILDFFNTTHQIEMVIR